MSRHAASEPKRTRRVAGCLWAFALTVVLFVACPPTREWLEFSFPIDAFALGWRRYGLTGIYEGQTWKPFDHERWVHPREENIRYLMMKDLLARHELVGMTADEVRRVLGPPQTVDARGWCWTLGAQPYGVPPWSGIVLALRMHDERVVDAFLTDA